MNGNSSAHQLDWALTSVPGRHESAASETGLPQRRTPIGPLCSVARIFRDLRKRVWPAPDRENLMTTKKATATPDAAEKTAQTPVETAAVRAVSTGVCAVSSAASSVAVAFLVVIKFS